MIISQLDGYDVIYYVGSYSIFVLFFYFTLDVFDEYLFYLNLDAFALMEGPAEKFIKTGSALFLKCTFHKSSGNPDFVFW